MNLANGILGEPNGIGNYLFCNNNPLMYTDPLGLASKPYDPHIPSTWHIPSSSSGNWSGTPGDSVFQFRDGHPLASEAPMGVRFSKGIADLSPFRVDLKNPLTGQLVKGEIRLTRGQTRIQDTYEALREFRHRLGKPANWKPSDDGLRMHHHKGKMLLIRKGMHGMAHTGGYAARIYRMRAGAARALGRSMSVVNVVAMYTGIQEELANLRYLTAPHPHRDELGGFVVEELTYHPNIWRPIKSLSVDYRKTYFSGTFAGVTVDIDQSEAEQLIRIARNKFGYTNIFGRWVPGSDIQELPVGTPAAWPGMSEEEWTDYIEFFNIPSHPHG
jgi:hypothetical protein